MLELVTKDKTLWGILDRQSTVFWTLPYCVPFVPLGKGWGEFLQCTRAISRVSVCQGMHPIAMGYFQFYVWGYFPSCPCFPYVQQFVWTELTLHHLSIYNCTPCSHTDSYLRAFLTVDPHFVCLCVRLYVHTLSRVSLYICIYVCVWSGVLSILYIRI